MPVGAFLTVSDGLSAPRIVWERWLYSVHRQLSPSAVREIHAMQQKRRSDEPHAPVHLAKERPSFASQRSERAPFEQVREDPSHDDESSKTIGAPIVEKLNSSFSTRAGLRSSLPPRPQKEAQRPHSDGFLMSSDAEETLTLPVSASVRWEVRCGERRWTLPASGVAIGRSSSAAIQIDDPHISRQHVELVPDGADLIVRALQTKNPTLVDGRTLHGETRIEAIDAVLLQIGSTELSIEPIFSSKTSSGRSSRDG